MDLLYCGNGAYLAGVPATDLVGVDPATAAVLLASGCYKEATPAPAPEPKGTDKAEHAEPAPAPEPKKRGAVPPAAETEVA